MKHTALGLLLLLFAATPSLAQDAPPPLEAHRLRVGAWNIENFGSRKPARVDEDYVRLGAYVKSLGVDVLAVEEVNGAAPLERLVKAIGPRWSFVIGTTGKVGRKKETTRQIGVGFLFNEERVELLDAYELNVPQREDGLYIFHRVPVVATFRSRDGGIDFRAVVVHFKAGQLDKNDKSEEDSNKRQHEVKHLIAKIDEILGRDGEDQDLLVMGDCNSGPRYPAWETLAKRLEHPAPAKAHRSIVHFEEQIDHVFLSKGLTEELVPGSYRICSEMCDKLGNETWRAQYSDHMPVTVDLDATADRDPEAHLTPGPREAELAPHRAGEPGPTAQDPPREDPEDESDDR